MFKNHLKLACRNLLRNKRFSIINIVGLALGLASCLIMMLFVFHEFSYDRFHENADRLVRVAFRGTVMGEKMNEASVMPPVAKTLLSDYPEVEAATRLRSWGTPTLISNQQAFHNNSFAFADENFFRLFTLPLIKGDPHTALRQPNTLVISETAAEKFFGNEDPIGKVVSLKGWEGSFVVTGLMKNIPQNSHFHVDFLASMASFPDANANSWMVSEFHTYLLLPAGYDYRQLEAKLPEITDRYIGPQLEQNMGISLSQFRAEGNDIGLYLQPLTDIHLYSEATIGLEPGGNIRYVYIFGAVAVFMLLIACINFMNFSTAGAARRAKEVGVRKVLGSTKKQLVWQFLTESVLLVLLAMLLAVAIVLLVHPFFSELTGRVLLLSPTLQPWFLPGLLLLILTVGLLAGSYPAFVLSSFKPVGVLKGWRMSGGRGGQGVSLRSGLVVFQFTISIGLMIGTLVVYEQLQYIQQKELGYQRDQVLVLPDARLLGKQTEAFRQQLLQDPRVLQVSTSGYLPAGPSFNNNFFVHPEGAVEKMVKTIRYDVDEAYLETLGIQLVAGRNFTTDLSSDNRAVILNESAARALGWGADAVGKSLTELSSNNTKLTYHIIGIVKDFHFRSLHEQISPLLMVLGHGAGSVIVKASTKDMAGLLASIQQQWTAINEEEPFTYSFLDERYQSAYEAEQKLGVVLALFAGLTIFVACLGLFGLALFTAERRTREIGIRKVLGASEKGIVLLLSRDFVKLVGIAFLLAAPIAWYCMHRWLEDYAYRIDISWWIFALAGGIALLIAFITISFQTVKAAMANPVKSLRSE